ncbi:hypothetical protein Q3G72_020842 [Acer saccharum]|nr:hypothetical protein Q3G72_020842 [Acer saccharum]
MIRVVLLCSNANPALRPTMLEVVSMLESQTIVQEVASDPGIPGKWNEPLIRRNFLPDEAELILSIPLSALSKRDLVLWHFDKNGIFSVKSAYRVAISAMRRFEASCSSGPHPRWKKLWCLQLPNKIKIFCWKACRNILPAKALLHKRGIIDSDVCPLCTEGPETVDHALWGCKNVKPEWSQCPLFSDLNKLKIAYFLERVIWVATVGNLENTNENQAKVSAKSSIEIKTWSHPTIGTFKVNVDAALDLGRGRFGAGIVIRDNTGRILKATALVFDGRVSADIAEAKAIYEGLLLAKKSGLHPLSIESDSLNVVRLCKCEITTRSDVFNVIRDVQILLNRDGMTSISHIPRICNRVAHEVARRAIGLENSVFLDDPSPFWL